MKTYTVTFLERVPRTPWAVSFRFGRPADCAFRAGQYMILDLGGQGRAHPLSLSDSPEEERFIEFTKRMSDSAFCARLKEIQPDESVQVKGPAGAFFPDAKETPLVFLAGGIGITPIRSILKHLAARNTRRKITLLYGNENEEDIAFGRELESLALERFRMIHVLHQPGETFSGYRGFINREIIAAEVEGFQVASYLISGPPGMVRAMQAQLQELAIPESSITTDTFFGY